MRRAALRAVVAPEPPTAALANRTVAGLELRRAPWWSNARLPLNPGLVAIVGPRGSGKTALADFVAIGGHADAVTDVPFVRRAARFLHDIELAVDWGDGTVVTRRPLEPEPFPFPRVQYLSQQFVERLCAADKSIFDELVGRFSDVRRRRQVIIVTHNANHVVNTDADQVIVADAHPRAIGELPSFRYMSGGLENPDVRDAVCSILEGGEAAFRERARRLRVVVST